MDVVGDRKGQELDEALLEGDLSEEGLGLAKSMCHRTTAAGAGQ